MATNSSHHSELLHKLELKIAKLESHFENERETIERNGRDCVEGLKQMRGNCVEIFQALDAIRVNVATNDATHAADLENLKWIIRALCGVCSGLVVQAITAWIG